MGIKESTVFRVPTEVTPYIGFCRFWYMKFDYYKFPLKTSSELFGSSILKPLIPVKISSGQNTIKHLVLLDSGADFCIFNAEVGESLGLDIKSGKKEKFGGIQKLDGSEAFLHKIVINIGGWDHVITVGFSYDIAKHGYGILGQKGFFEIFSVKFDYSKEAIEIKPVAK